MILLFFPMLLLVPPTLSIVDCIIACSRCQERAEEYPGVLDVYCTMCQECKDRRKERRLRDRGMLREQIIYNLDDIPEGCPTPPPCEPDLEDFPPITLAYKTLQSQPTSPPSTITTEATTTPTTRPPCPPVPPCKKRQSIPCYYPCLPMCPCPYPMPYHMSNGSHKLVETSTTSSTGHIYVYIGVPKDILRKKNL